MNLDNSYVVIDISELSGDLLTVGMYIGLDYMWDKAKEDLTRRKQIFIDEVWQIIGASSNALAANYVFEAVKTIRGYGGGVLVATQDLNDFFSLEDGKYGRGILNNCKIKIILNLEEEEAQRYRYRKGYVTVRAKLPAGGNVYRDDFPTKRRPLYRHQRWSRQRTGRQ